MSTELTKSQAADTPRYNVEQAAADLLSRLTALESQLSWLISQAHASNAWADRWAKEQVQLGLLTKALQQNLLSTEELQDFRSFMESFRKFIGE